MNKRLLFSIILLLNIIATKSFAQSNMNLHSNLKDPIDLEAEGYVKIRRGFKYNVKSESLKECSVHIVKTSLSFNCNNKLTYFYPVLNGKAYKDNKGNVILTEELDGKLRLQHTKSTHYYIVDEKVTK